MQQDTDYTRLFLAIFLAASVLIGWQSLVEAPRRQELAKIADAYTKKQAVEKEKQTATLSLKDDDSGVAENLTHAQQLAQSPRITIRSDKLHGSIALRGARFDDLTLAKYRETLDKDSPEVTLFLPTGHPESFLAHIGWVAGDGKTKVPDQNTLWQADKKQLSPGDSVTLRWNNGEGQTYLLIVSMDADYMFSIEQRVENKAARSVSVAPYGYVNRAHVEVAQHYGILHEGPIGVMESSLQEINYQDLRENGNKTFENSSGWLGITDKYWLAALVPGESGYKTTFSHYSKNEKDRYQVDYLAPAQTIEPGATASDSVRLFAGAKEIKVLDRYATGDAKRGLPPIELFDRAVDFGVLYFMTKPMFLTLNFFYALAGNFGIAILLLTILVKLLMFPLANKSYKSMSQMRMLQPEMTKIRERHVDDQIAMNKAMLELYKKEKVNPASGCLPLLIQMPVFFALYKVLYVTIEMRHAPFFGWLKDLSAIDSSNIFTLFGLIDWNHPAWMHLGILPILYCITMVIQMRLQPKPADPVQAKMMAFMPYFFLFIFASFPAGLVLYWVWSNILSILQQQYITYRYTKNKPPAKGAKAAA
jgi:YidC/Oxa1 family membrane protein insertase